MKEITLFFLSSYLFCSLTWAVPAQTHKIMITAPSPRAVEVGQEVAAKGGNVVDVAIAVELALAVTSPYYASLGGGGFAMVKMGKNEVKALDFRETAPIMTHPNFYANRGEKASTHGALAVGIPGMIAGLWELHNKHGKLPWNQLFEGALKLAEKGFPVSGDWVKLTEKGRDHFNSPGLKYFFKGAGVSYKPGEVLVQTQLAQALKLLKAQGPKAFYEGPLGKDIIQTLKRQGGVMADADLKNYKTRWLTPITKNFQGYTVHMMPPPSSSGVVTSSLITLVDLLKIPQTTPTSTEEYHLLAEALRIAYRGRSHLGDPDFHKNPLEKLTSTEYLKPLANQVRSSRITKLEPLPEEKGKESSETTNFTVMDSDGNTVVMTITLNGNYGSFMVSDKYGIALNNEMDDFTTNPQKPNMFGLIQGKGNLVEAGKRPLSSMSPTIIEKDKSTVLALGASGGPRIISSVFQVWYRVLVSQRDMDRAIQTPRIHHQFAPNVLYVDEQQFSADTHKNLQKLGHTVESSWMGRVNGIFRHNNGILEGAYDSRVEGAAGGI